MALEQVNIFITGIVQGVGFRPFVFRLADQYDLRGTVLNDHRGVTIIAQGEPTAINACLKQLEQNPPPLARIDKIDVQYQSIETAFSSFTIIESDKGNAHAVVALSADKSTCQDCLDEMADPNNRHFGYPFTNCTNCGPRYSIINALPYDRHQTAMASFAMCQHCEAAYTNPLDRRYHAQPVSCPHCGPQLRLLTLKHDSALITSNAAKTTVAHIAQQDVIAQTASLLAQGQVIAIKGLGGFHLICDATQDDAVNTLRQRKVRPAKPLAVMVPNIEQAKALATGSDAEWRLLASAEKPIVVMDKLVKHRSNNAINSDAQPVPSIQLSDAVAPGIDRLGLFLPYTPLHHLLLQQFAKPIVATSANKSGEPIICDVDTLIADLGHVIDAVVDHDRAIINACDDSVVQLVNDQLQVIRLARGYAPLTLPNPCQESIKESDQETSTSCANPHRLAVGGQQKNAVAFAFANNMILSPHIGDLFSLEAISYFERSLATFKRLYDFTPQQIICDKHPDYAPSRWAQAYKEQQSTKVLQPTNKQQPTKVLQPTKEQQPALQLQTVQHHHGHILAMMAANQVTDTVLGFSFDGTGLGEDNCLWGSEVMLANCHDYQVIAHFSEFKLIGGEQAIKQPVRILLALLFAHFDIDTIASLPINAIQKLSRCELNNLYLLWKKPQHGIACRSVGRLFDALAVALNLIETNQFEGQAGMLIEAQASQADALTLDAHSTATPLTIAATQYVTEQNLAKQSQPIAANQAVTQWDAQGLFKQIIEQLMAHQAQDKQTQVQQTKVSINGVLCQQFIHALAASIRSICAENSQYSMVFCGGVFQNKVLLKQCLQQCQLDGHTVLPSGQVPVNDGGLALGQLWAAIHSSPPKKSAGAEQINNKQKFS